MILKKKKIVCDKILISLNERSEHAHPKMAWPGARSKGTSNNRKNILPLLKTVKSGSVSVKDLLQANTHVTETLPLLTFFK